MPTRKRGKLYILYWAIKRGYNFLERCSSSVFGLILFFQFISDISSYFSLARILCQCFSSQILLLYPSFYFYFILYASNPIPPAPSKSRRVGCMILVYQANCSPFFYWFKFSLCVCVPMQKRQTKKAKLFSLVFAARPMSYSNWRVVSLREVGNRLT